MARQGQKPHSNHPLKHLRDESCPGAVGRAYRREQTDGRQRWIVIGEYCDGCQTFWPITALGWRRKLVPVPAGAVAEDEDDVPNLVRFMRGESPDDWEPS